MQLVDRGFSKYPLYLMLMANLIEILPGRIVNVVLKKHPNKNKNTLFFFHGVGGRSAQWRYQIEYFAQDYNIVAMDYLGHGESLKPIAASYDFTSISADAQVVFQRYKTQNNFIVGHSYGGAIAVDIAAKQANITKIVLLAPLPYRLRIPFRRLLYLPDIQLQFLRTILITPIYKRLLDSKTHTDLLITEMRSNLSNPIYVIKNTLLGIKDMPKIDLSLIQQPTLLLVSPIDPIIRMQQIQTFYQALPHVNLQLIHNAKHLMMLEKPAEINQLIAEFLKEK